MRYFQIILLVFQLLFLKIVVVPAQKVGEVVDTMTNYQLLLTRFQVIIEYYLMSDEVKDIYDEALIYGQSEEYDIAIIMLEEALFLLQQRDDNSDLITVGYNLSTPSIRGRNQDFKFGVITGIDYNRQEFEVSDFRSDSTINEEFNKPYVGVIALYNLYFGTEGNFEIYNSFRYDKENLRDDYRFRWRPSRNFYIQYMGYLNQARISETYTFWEQILSTKISNQAGTNLYWSFLNTLNHKSYETGTSFIKDYFRNRFFGLIEWRTSLLGILSMEYGNEFNESLGLEDNDYIQHNLRFGLRNDNFYSLYYNVFIDGGVRDYTIVFDDSLIKNEYKSISVDAIYEVAILEDFRFVIEDNFLHKVYQNKSSLEPDYYWNNLRPGFRFNLLSNLEIGLGYEWEFKEHISIPTESYNVNEQNYNSNGIFLSGNLFSLSGTYISASVSYQWRRYPKSVTNDFISIYSNRNVFSTMLIAYIPFSNYFSVNAFVTYDDDEDIDFDQQNNQSTIFNVELEYTF